MSKPLPKIGCQIRRPPPVSMAQSAWLWLARKRGVTDREYRLGVELFSFAGSAKHLDKPRCWREGDAWVYRVWPRIEPAADDPPVKQDMALTRRMGCERRKIELGCVAEAEGTHRRESGAGGPPAYGAVQRQADTVPSCLTAHQRSEYAWFGPTMRRIDRAVRKIMRILINISLNLSKENQPRS